MCVDYATFQVNPLAPPHKAKPDKPSIPAKARQRT
jgi:hypothetical protein